MSSTVTAQITFSDDRFWAGLGIDLVAIVILAYVVYFRRHRRRDLLMAYVCFNVALFAVVMVVVFSVFITLSFLDFKEMGLGLATAVLIDATVVRGVLLPASMKVLGDWNWYLPKWLEWIPRVSHEPVVEPAKPEPAAEPVHV